ncbi:PAS domain-containing protein [Rhizobiales bacterium RZME27]|uniref:histidine kinase n=1 Tax=Endobacterium cereale TaxID=2663029 RepID=A0A6A8AEZ8_9HYPH|nr:histidine kinase dimerization/phosphoacceptor domain -containing protein [Endobacterium cereale]MEB2848485.1 histidine kinase dimerization/phosphoacceptor domain -containing protein [Endobacterium cereale]MQY49349.1 PAS domain-containing protein [Endobacterium cereale]
MQRPNAATDFALILEGMPQPYLILDAELTIVGASDAYLALTDRLRDDIVGKSILVAFPENPDEKGTVEQGPLEVSLRHALATGKPHEMAVIQYDIPLPSGGFAQKFWTPIHSPVTDAEGHVQYIIQNPMDVTESVLKAREDDARLRVAMHAADLASWEYEPETDIWRRSHAVDELFGFGPGEGGAVAANFFARMHPDDLPVVQDGVRSILGCPDETVVNFEYRVVLPNGKIRHLSSRGEVLRTTIGKVRMIGVIMDVTADRAREAALSAAVTAQSELLDQKDALLAEVNHRVKNSLQLVVSTLRLQSRRIDVAATKAVFDVAISRVRAIISVHERLYRADNALKVDMKEQLGKLCLDLTGDKAASHVSVDVDNLELPTEKAIPISVIVNELLMAVLQDTLENGRRLTVSLKRIRAGYLELAVTGNVGTSCLPELGTKLVRSMAAQMDGEFTDVSYGDGYRAAVVFKGAV